LAGANGAFASSLAIPPGGDKVVVAYGVADAESRALVMSKAYLDPRTLGLALPRRTLILEP
jgi:hypothetical protein